MTRIKKPKPLAVCNVCGAYTGEAAYVNSRCNTVVTGRRCSGVFRAGLGHVWIECQECKGFGQLGTQVCSPCAGFGWKLMG
jgi:hypothetical protein